MKSLQILDTIKQVIAANPTKPTYMPSAREIDEWISFGINWLDIDQIIKLIKSAIYTCATKEEVIDCILIAAEKKLRESGEEDFFGIMENSELDLPEDQRVYAGMIIEDVDDI